MIKTISIGIILLGTSIAANAQDSTWTSEELSYYSTARALCQFLTHSKYDTGKRHILLDKYVLFFEMKGRETQPRIEYFDGLFSYFARYIDSVGLENLDAKPVRFFKSNTAAYKPFDNHLKWAATSTFFYYNKKEPSKPLGPLFFDPKSKKLAAWLWLNFGGELIFLTPNLY